MTIVAASVEAIPDEGLAPIEPDLTRALPLIEARLQVRHPGTPSARIIECIDVAIGRAEGARVRTFLPILVERWAELALAGSAAGDGLHDRDGGAVGDGGL